MSIRFCFMQTISSSSCLIQIHLNRKPLQIMSDFGYILRFKINLAKSLFPINQRAQQMSFQSFPFSVCFDKFLYLGVSVTRRCKDLFNNSFKTALDKAKRDMVRWSILPLSTLLKWQYYQDSCFYFSLCLFLFPDHLSKIWIIVLPYFFGIKKKKIEHLERKEEEGGLAMANFLYSYCYVLHSKWANSILRITQLSVDHSKYGHSSDYTLIVNKRCLLPLFCWTLYFLLLL